MLALACSLALRRSSHVIVNIQLMRCDPKKAAMLQRLFTELP